VFLDTQAWRKTSKAYLAVHPLCEQCNRNGLIVAAVDVHHIVERVDDPSLAFAWDNLQALCKSCHSTITKERQQKGNSDDSS